MKTFGRKGILRRTLVLSFASTLFVTLLCGQTTPQSQDALQGKLNYLKTKLESYLTYSEKEGEGPELGNVRFEAIRFDSCRIAWRSSAEFGQNGNLPSPLTNFRIVNQVSVDLSSLNPARTRIYIAENMARRNLRRSLLLELHIRPGSPRFKHQMETTSGGRVIRTALEEKSYAFFFEKNDQSVAEEIAKAFADASNICRLRVRRNH